MSLTIRLPSCVLTFSGCYLQLWRFIFREDRCDRRISLIKRERCGDLLDGDKTDLGYRRLHTCLECLSSSGQWHPQSPPPDGKALWCLAPAEKTGTHESRIKEKGLWIWGECSEMLCEHLTHKRPFIGNLDFETRIAIASCFSSVSQCLIAHTTITNMNIYSLYHRFFFLMTGNTLQLNSYFQYWRKRRHTVLLNAGDEK